METNNNAMNGSGNTSTAAAPVDATNAAAGILASLTKHIGSTSNNQNRNPTTQNLVMTPAVLSSLAARGTNGAASPVAAAPAAALNNTLNNNTDTANGTLSTLSVPHSSSPTTLNTANAGHHSKVLDSVAQAHLADVPVAPRKNPAAGLKTTGLAAATDLGQHGHDMATILQLQQAFTPDEIQALLTAKMAGDGHAGSHVTAPLPAASRPIGAAPAADNSGVAALLQQLQNPALPTTTSTMSEALYPDHLAVAKTLQDVENAKRAHEMQLLQELSREKQLQALLQLQRLANTEKEVQKLHLSLLAKQLQENEQKQLQQQHDLLEILAMSDQQSRPQAAPLAASAISNILAAQEMERLVVQQSTPSILAQLLGSAGPSDSANSQAPALSTLLSGTNVATLAANPGLMEGAAGSRPPQQPVSQPGKQLKAESQLDAVSRPPSEASSSASAAVAGAASVVSSSDAENATDVASEGKLKKTPHYQAGAGPTNAVTLSGGVALDKASLEQLLQLQQQGASAQASALPQAEPSTNQALVALLALQQSAAVTSQAPPLVAGESAFSAAAQEPMKLLVKGLQESQAAQHGLKRPAPVVAIHQQAIAAASSLPIVTVEEEDVDQEGPSPAKKQKRGRTGTFPQKLHTMLNDMEKNGTTDIASFCPDGKAFTIHRSKEFAKFVMPKYFRMGSFASFQRQLNLYNFERIGSGPSRGAYRHEKFVRGQPLLSTSMVRTKIKGKFAAKQQQATD